jgi:hypothetical protein
MADSEAYRRFIVLRFDYTFDTFVKVAAKCERKENPPAYIGKVRGEFDLIEAGVPLIVQLVVNEIINEGVSAPLIGSLTYMAIKDDTDLMKVRLYCPEFLCLYDYQNTMLLEGNPL